MSSNTALDTILRNASEQRDMYIRFLAETATDTLADATEREYTQVVYAAAPKHIVTQDEALALLTAWVDAGNTTRHVITGEWLRRRGFLAE